MRSAIEQMGRTFRDYLPDGKERPALFMLCPCCGLISSVPGDEFRCAACDVELPERIPCEFYHGAS